MEDRGGVLHIAIDPDDGGLAIGDRLPRQCRQRLRHQALAKLGAERNQDVELVGLLARERVADHRASCNAGDRLDGREPPFGMNGVFDDHEATDVHVLQVPINRSKFRLSTSSAQSGGSASRTNVTGLGTTSGNGASLPITKCSTGTMVVAKRRIAGSKQAVSK